MTENEKEMIIELVHTTLYGFFEPFSYEELEEKPFNQTEKTLLEVNKVLCNKIIEMPTVEERPHGNWEYLKEHITEMRDADGELNQKQTCQFILNLMGVIEREGEEE